MVALKYCFEHLIEIQNLYVLSDLEDKHRLINTIFKENLVFENLKFRTPKLNSAAELICSNSGLSRIVNKKSDPNFESLSLKVGDEGFEPPTLPIAMHRDALNQLR